VPRISVNKVKSYWQKHGTLGLVTKVLSRLCSPFFSYNPLNFYCIVGLPQIQLKPRCPLEIRRGNPEDIDSMEEMLSYMNETTVHKQIRENFDNGGVLFLAFSEGKLVHIAWLHYCAGAEKTYPHVKIDKDEAFIGRCDTDPEFRGNNIYPVVLQHIVGYATEKNKRRCYITTAPTLAASIRGIEKAGFSFAGKLRRFRFFGKTFNNQWVSSETFRVF
jgi:RimJ/RimL family protein N-acetyltransferase